MKSTADRQRVNVLRAVTQFTRTKWLIRFLKNPTAICSLFCDCELRHCWFYLGGKIIICSSKFNSVVHTVITSVSSTGGCVHRGLSLLLSVVLFVAMVPAGIVTPRRATDSQRVNAQERNVITYVYLGNLLYVCIYLCVSGKSVGCLHFPSSPPSAPMNPVCFCLIMYSTTKCRCVTMCTKVIQCNCVVFWRKSALYLACFLIRQFYSMPSF